jgi:hypothetical protein
MSSALPSNPDVLPISRHVRRVAALLGSGRAKSASHSTSAPAGGTSGWSSDANTIRSAAHTRSACFADLNDNPVRLLEGYQGHSLRR